VKIDVRPWRRLLAVWLPAVVLCLVTAAVYVWQTSESGGRRAQIQNEIEELEKELARLERMQQVASSDREAVAEINRQFDLLYNDTFGNLEERLTKILREVGLATREAGLLPSTFNYSAKEYKDTVYIRFGVRFAVQAEYRQIREMLAALQASPEFLVVENLNLTGDEDPINRELALSVNIATFLAEADEAQLRRLTGGISKTAESTDG
jgi:Tfp pilus assembly protein PilO